MPERTAPIKVFIADDSAMVQGRVAAVLASQAISIVGCADSLHGSIDGILAARPDVVVLDVQLKGGTGLQLMHAVRQMDPGIAFVVFTIEDSPAFRKGYLDEGAQCYLDKATQFHQLASAVEQASLHAR
jgi:DNA-binding NarL/FixJ family response regulator